jgi:hypothetical protein
MSHSDQLFAESLIFMYVIQNFASNLCMKTEDINSDQLFAESLIIMYVIQNFASNLA